MNEEKLRSDTLGIIGGYGKAEAVRFKSFPPPLSQTVSYPLESAQIAQRIYDVNDPYMDFVYTRRNNPTNDIFEKRMALMERGEAALATSSGMSAIFNAASYFLKAGSECVISNRVYTRAFEIFTKIFNKFGVKTRVVNEPTNLMAWEKLVSKHTRLMYVETPSNPGLVVCDLQKLADLANSFSIPLIVDNTLATTVATRPLEMGAAVVIESVSKYVSGNGTTLGGVLVTKKEWVDEIRRSEYVQYGTALAPFNSWLCLLGLETLGLRMKKHTSNAMTVASFLESHPKVARVNYPGLVSHPQHDLARRQMNEIYGGLLSFVLKEESRERIFMFLDSLQIITHAIHESAARSVICNPPSTNFADLGQEELALAGIPLGLVRLSVGIEDPQDLIEDLDRALALL